jgi:cytochrome c biogenesis protein CcdA
MKTKILISLFIFSILVPIAQAKVCAVYFTGIGCPHCAKTDPVILEQLLKEFPDLVIIEYEIYQQSENAPLLYIFNLQYNSGLGVPLIIFNKAQHIRGDIPILNNIKAVIQGMKENSCPLPDGSSIGFEDLDVNDLPGKPKIWLKDKILVYSEGGGDGELLREVLLTENLSATLKGKAYQTLEAKPIPLSGKYVNFDNAIKIDGWIFQWRGEAIEEKIGEIKVPKAEQVIVSELTFAKIVSLALVDAINPCALAVLTLMLIGILTYNPKVKRNVLFAGLAFTSSVFLIYLFYGLILIKFFQLVQLLTSIRLILYQLLGLGAIGLGILQIKDFVKYKPGGFLTEMPLKWRPRVKKIISKIASPKGAFLIGAFVTIFLLPCTIGPYIIASGILSVLELLRTIPWLLLYNLIFVFPMIAITLIVYLGVKKIEDISGWKEKNIRYLHLIAGIVIFLLGVGMIFGLV